jgi:hypothetical protein
LCIKQNQYKERDEHFKYKLFSLSNVNPKEMGILEKIIPPNEKDPFQVSIDILKNVNKFQNASEKFNCLVESSNEMKKILDNIKMDQGADDLFPISIHIFVKANITNVYSLFKFLQDFADETVVESEQSYRLTIFELVLDFIDSIDVNIKDNLGTLVPIEMFKDQLEQCVRKIFFVGKQNKTAPNLTWISSLFIEIGNIHESKKDMSVSIPSLSDKSLSTEEMEDLGNILKIVGLRFKSDSLEVIYDMVYPTTVYVQMAKTLEKLLYKNYI